MHRIRVGLIGLAWVFLLVMLATALVHVTGDGTPEENVVAPVNDAAPSEPLAELGVAPGNPDPNAAPADAQGKHHAPAP